MSSRLTIVESSEEDDATTLPESAKQRGIQNPMVIDLIEGFPEKGLVEVSMMEFREDTDNLSRLKEIELKYNNTLEYILGGYLQAHYPAYEGFEIQVVYQHTSEPKGQTLPLLQAMAKAAVQHGLQFESRQISEHIQQ